MSLANRYRGGEGLVLQWITSGGTFTMSDDYTTFDVDKSIDLIEVTAGSEADKVFVNGIKDGSAKLTFYAQGAGGTANEAQLVEGTAGTLVYSPRGTASGKPKRGFAAIIKSGNEKWPNDEAAEVSVEWQKQGAMVYAVPTTW